ncbi:unnamed protein product [Closterium sp. NIES-64]|nr:unnamed protein product [Closterium sp. NIES-64]
MIFGKRKDDKGFDIEFSSDDISSIHTAHSSSGKFLDKYSLSDMETMLQELGVMAKLRKRGHHTVNIELDLTDPFVHKTPLCNVSLLSSSVSPPVPAAVASDTLLDHPSSPRTLPAACPASPFLPFSHFLPLVLFILSPLHQLNPSSHSPLSDALSHPSSPTTAVQICVAYSLLPLPFLTPTPLALSPPCQMLWTTPAAPEPLCQCALRILTSTFPLVLSKPPPSLHALCTSPSHQMLWTTPAAPEPLCECALRILTSTSLLHVSALVPMHA